MGYIQRAKKKYFSSAAVKHITHTIILFNLRKKETILLPLDLNNKW